MRIFAAAKVSGRKKSARGTKRERSENLRQYPLLYAPYHCRESGTRMCFTFSATGICREGVKQGRVRRPAFAVYMVSACGITGRGNEIQLCSSLP